MNLTDEQMKTFRTLVRLQGENGCHDGVFDALHEEAEEAVSETLRDRGIDVDDLSRTDVDTLLEAYNEGFWEPTHLDERRALKEQIANLTAALAEKFAAESAEDIRFPGLFVPRVPMMSTAHITKEDADKLDDASCPAVIARSPGTYFLHIGGRDFDYETEFAEFSETFRNLLLRLNEAGYNYVRFDSTHGTADPFPTIEW